MLPLLEMFAGQANPCYKSDGLLELQRTIPLCRWMISITLPHMSLQDEWFSTATTLDDGWTSFSTEPDIYISAVV